LRIIDAKPTVPAIASGRASERTPSATHALPISDRESVLGVAADPDKDGLDAAWSELPPAVRASITMLVRAASK